MNELQTDIVAKGKEIFALMQGQQANAFSREKLAGRLLDWSMRNDALKSQLFRFVDVLPSLESSREIARHAADYLGETEAGLPKAVRWGVHRARYWPWLTAVAARQGVLQIAKMFIVARSAEDALPKLEAMRSRNLAFTLDILGETVLSETEAETYGQRYLDLLDKICDAAERWPNHARLDSDGHGAIPKVNLSVKISALYSQFHPADPEDAIEHLSLRLLPLLKRARERGAFINFDMESTAIKDVTIELFKRLLTHPDLKDYPHAGLAFQAYLRESERDLESLIAWVKARGQPIAIRLIKGAYWDYETILARQRGWPVPVFDQKEATDANYELLAKRLLENENLIRCAFGTHSVRTIASCLVQAERLGVPKENLEFQMLYGMAEPIKQALVQLGLRVRDYCPIGEILPGMSYLVRRLLENTANQGFLRATFSEHASPEELLREPHRTSGMTEQASRLTQPATRTEAPGTSSGSALFKNEPITDFTKPAARQAMKDALARVRNEFGREYPIVIAGQEIFTAERLLSINPARPEEVIGRVAKAGIAEAEHAIVNARVAFLDWRRRSVEERAGLIEKAADLLHQERFRFAALEIFETGKNWIESDADVAEAIDFCRYYAAEMRRLAGSNHAVPGENSWHHYIPRGLAAVIAPWNFPLAILCGMTAAALVTGNCVIMKPSEQSSVVAAWFFDLLRRAGLPAGVVNFLPGSGETIGSYLVRHPQISIIAFTGSREVGLQIHEAAGQTAPGQPNLKKVICEMGGKNAAIVDNDADLDEAIPAIVHSAFGYQGQKCSALSRLILLEGTRDRVLRRLIEACRDLRIGPPEAPRHLLGPVIEAKAYARIQEYLGVGKTEGELVFQGSVPCSEGFFIPPTIFANVSPKARIAQEEIFGPILAVIPARDFDEALQIANECPYALTGGLFSRSPRHIQRVKAELEAGNVYINRAITGAMVARHPFGGFKMSGGGAKAGGPDYLQNFMFPRVVTENLMRRGFAPEEPGTTVEPSGE